MTVITRVDDAITVQDALTELLGSPPALETHRDAVLGPSADWYRVALQRVTHVGLDVLDARGGAVAPGPPSSSVPENERRRSPHAHGGGPDDVPRIDVRGTRVTRVARGP